ncbi:MAG TPA: efflux RND transporter permease subunit [Candidatus Binataceae bacterium]
MWVVEVALRRPISVAVMALLMLVLGSLSFALMNVDIFPAINIPVVMLVWSYPGLSAVDTERRVVTLSERAMTTTVNGIDHIESESLPGVGLIRVYFQPDATIASAIAQISAVTEAILAGMPRGMEPPNIIEYNAANVPVAQINVWSDTLSESQLFDYGANFIRLRLFTIPGLASPAPLGGVGRSVMVNLDPAAMYANQLSASAVGQAVASTNVVIPSGTARMGDREFNIDLNMSPTHVPEFNRLPVKAVTGITGGTPVFLGDLATGSRPLLVVETLKPLRIYAQVPQSQALFIRDGDKAVVAVTELPHRRFVGSVTRHSKSLTDTTRTMLVEVDLPNEDLALYPGMYAKIEVTLNAPAGVPLAPDGALVFKHGKTYVPVVRQGHLHLIEVALGYDDGQNVQILSGLSSDDVVALNMGQAAQDGEPVQPVLQQLD